MLCENAAEVHITGNVDVSEMMGSSIHLHVSAEGKDIIVIISTIDLSDEAHGRLATGIKVGITFGGNVIHMFSKTTEKNLI